MPSNEWKKLYNKSYNLWKEICFLRDGRMCQVEFHFGHFEGLRHSSIYQVDHCFARGDHNLHLDTSNGTVVCNICNSTKHWAKSKSPVNYLIFEIVKHREGMERFDEMLKVSQSKKENINWGKAWWMEEQVGRLTTELKEAKEKINEKEQG